MRWGVLAAVGVVGVAIAGVWHFTGGGSPLAHARTLLASTHPADLEAQRAELRRIAAARDVRLLPEVTWLWERTFAQEGFQQRDFRPGSPAPDIHAVFIALGAEGASQLVAWAEAEGRFIPCLLAAGVALGGVSSAEVGHGQVIGGVQVRRWWFQLNGRRLEVPTFMEGDWYGQLEIRRTWEDAVNAATPR